MMKMHRILLIFLHFLRPVVNSIFLTHSVFGSGFFRDLDCQINHQTRMNWEELKEIGYSP